jgi:ribose/xylose/arabinose/galactoside ABC-type transport system permease subunit
LIVAKLKFNPFIETLATSFIGRDASVALFFWLWPWSVRGARAGDDTRADPRWGLDRRRAIHTFEG